MSDPEILAPLTTLFGQVAGDLADIERLHELIEAEARQQRPEIEQPYQAPRDPAEELLARLWQRTLGLERVGVNDSFFAIGGNSLLAAQVLSGIRQCFGVEIPLTEIFRAPTLAGLAETVSRYRHGAAAPAPPIAPVPRAGRLALTFAQQRLWFMDQLQLGSPVYNIPLVLHLEGDLAPGALERGLGEVIRRHESLRTSFPLVDGEPAQVIAPAGAFHLPQVDLSGLPAAAGERELRSLVEAEARRAFDLSRGPLLRAALLRMPGARWALQVTTHHIVFDGSLELFMGELAALYRGLAAGEPPVLPEPPVQYADFAAWQRSWWQGERLETELAFWVERLRGSATELALPTDRPRPAVQSFRGARRFCDLPAGLLQALEAAAGRAGCTRFMLLLAAFDALLFRSTEREDLVVGFPIQHRPRPESEGLIGCFVDLLALRASFSGTDSFTGLLAAVCEEVLAAFAHRDLPFEVLVGALQPGRSLSHSPLCQVLFTLVDAPAEGLEIPGLAVRCEQLDPGTSRVDLLFGIGEVGGRWELMVEYAADLFDGATIVRLQRHYRTLLEGIAADPCRSLLALPLLAAEERHQILLEWNDTAAERSGAWRAHELFAAWAEREPGRTALLGPGGRMSYGELADRAGRLARRLRSLGVGPEVTVAVHLERSPAMVVALLGILQAGGCYVPVETSQPPARIERIFAAVRPRHLLTQESRLGLLERIDPALVPAHVVCLDGLGEKPAGPEALPAVAPGPAGCLDSSAYVIFTSGSTGAPKGVQVRHRALANLLAWAGPTFGLGPSDRGLFVNSLGFDLSVYDIFGLLAVGGAVRIATGEELADPERLAAVLCGEEITFWNSAPAALRQLVPFLAPPQPGEEDRAIRLVLLSGDWIPLALPGEVRRAFPGARVLSLGGATEATVWSNLFPVGEVDPSWPSIPYGRPMDNASYHVLDAGLRPCPVGVPGDLYIGGACLAAGYTADPALTAGRYLPDPFSGHPGERLYRTGDRARYLADGNLEFLGRRDQQVKVRGFRVELGEIEAALGRHPAVREAAVVARGEEPAGRELVAYVVPTGDAAPGVPELRALVGESLPDYMIPTAFVVLPALPLTASGKVDRKALPASGGARPELSVSYVPPRAPVEEVLAEIWRQLLGVPRVGVHDDFFELGGHSLLATQIVSRVREAFRVALPLRALFEQPTVARQAAAVSALCARAAEPVLDLPPLAADPDARFLPFPLTDVQQAYWVGRNGFELGEVAAHLYLELEGDLDLARLERAWQRAVERHEMLRAVVLPTGEQQILREVPPYRIAEVDLRGVPGPAAEAELAAIRREMSHQVLPSDRWPLFEIRASRLVGRLRLHVSLDVLILDAWSLEVLSRDVALFYDDPAAAPAPLAVSFRDYVLAEQRLRGSELHRRSLEHWTARIADLPPAPQLPRAGGELLRAPRFTRRSGGLDAAAWQRLKARGARAGLTPSSLLLTAFADVLAAWSRQPRCTLNLTLFNRLPLHPQVDRLLGDFTSLTLLAVDAAAAASFEERARALQSRLWDDLDHRYAGGVQVLRELARVRGRASAAMPFVFTSTLGLGRPVGAAGELRERARQVYAITQTPQVLLDHQVYEADEALGFDWDTVEAAFPPGLLDDLFAAYRSWLERLASSPETWLEPGRPPLPSWQAELWAACNATAGPAAGTLLHLPFAEQARKRPGSPAVIAADRTVTYGELHGAAARIAARLSDLGARPGLLVAVFLERGWEQAAAALGTLAAGAAYLPIDPQLPEERVHHLLEQGAVELVLTHPHRAAAVEKLAAVRAVSIGPEVLAGPAAEWPDPVQGPDDLAYVIFTSGSTGLPKGVMIDHRGAVNTVLDINRRFAVGPEDRGLAVSSLGFDLSVYDLFGLFAAGGTVVLRGTSARPDPAEWLRRMEQERVTVWSSVPALMELLVESAEQRGRSGLGALRLVLLSGDWIPVSLPDRIRALAPQARVISLGGATEASIWSIFHPIDAVDPAWTSIPYGRPLTNQTVWVLRPDLEPCPVWVEGEIWIGGAGVARGYWRNPDRTAASFVVHPRTGERLYRTGDLGRLRPDGSIEIRGREDLQVKVQGHRIELGEVEAALARHPEVRAGVVQAVGSGSARRLVAWVVPAAGAAPTAERLRHFLLGKLPEHMVPAAFVFVETLPLSANGKVDRQALRDPGPAAAARPEHAAGAYTAVGRIGQLVGGFLGRERLDPGASLLDLGASSVDMVRIANLLECEMGFRPQIDELYLEPTLAGLAALYERHRSASAAGGAAPPETSGARGAREVLSDPEERERFKKIRPGLRRLGPDRRSVPLAAPLDEALALRYRRRRSCRTFDPAPVPFESLGRLLRCLGEIDLDGEPKYLYPSAGGLYPVQVHLHVRPGRVEGLPAGTWYHDPVEARLVALAEGVDLDSGIHVPFVNRPIFEQAAFSLFLVAQREAIEPMYGVEDGLRFALLEAGYLSQLLMMEAPACGLGLCPIGRLELERVRHLFLLDEGHVLVHSLLGGVPAAGDGARTAAVGDFGPGAADAELEEGEL